MEKEENKINISDFLFMSGWFVFMLSYVLLKESEIMYLFDTTVLYKTIKYFIIAIFMTKIIFVDKYSFKKILLYLIVLGITFFNTYSAKTDVIFFTLLVAFSAHKVDLKRFIKFDLCVRIFIVSLILFLCFVGVLPNFAREINGSFKQALGFSHPNILCLNVITILLEYMYLNKKINFKFICINLGALMLLIILCNARTSIYAYLIILFIYVLVKNKEEMFTNKFVKKIVCILPIIMTVISLFLVIQYGNNNDIMIRLDKLLTTRISNGYRFLKEYGINLWGNEIETVGTRTSIITGKASKILDMGYLRMLICNGVLVCVIFNLILCKFQKLLIEYKDYKLLLICTFFLILGLTENNIYNIAFNFTLIAFIDKYNNVNIVQEESN